MSDFKPGDIVDVEIRGAEVVRVDPGGLGFRLPGRLGYNLIRLDEPELTVTRRAPQPRAGDVWRMADGDVRFIISDGCEPEALWGQAYDRHTGVSVGFLDFTGATRLFTLEEAPDE